jgi:hypothetical protein
MRMQRLLADRLADWESGRARKGLLQDPKVMNLPGTYFQAIGKFMFRYREYSRAIAYRTKLISG